MHSGTTTKILRETEEYFIAELDNGNVRIGIVGGEAALDTPHDHDKLLYITAVATNLEFDKLTEDYFYSNFYLAEPALK